MKFTKVHVVQPGANLGWGLEGLFLAQEGTAQRDGWTLTGHAAGIVMAKGEKTYLLPWARVALTEVDTSEKGRAA